MYLEIEAKLKVESLADVERRLSECGAVFVSVKTQVDCYFDTDDGQLTQTDRCLRLRAERTDDRTHYILTYKGPRQADDFKKREEINLAFGDDAAVERLIEGLGYRRALAFDKRRSVWNLDDCEVALDELPLLGAFVEIEGPDAQRIDQVRAALGLQAAPHVMESYAALIDEALSQRGSRERQVFL